MKIKFFAALIVATMCMVSCSIDDGDSVNISYALVPVESVEMPRQFVFGEIYDIPVTFTKNECQSFEGFEVNSNLNERKIGVVVSSPEEECAAGDISEIQNLRFLVASNGSYVFKFFTGYDANNEPEFLEYTVMVEE